jgi:hypothetical protein
LGMFEACLDFVALAALRGPRPGKGREGKGSRKEARA